jgi:hypothetical protein
MKEAEPVVRASSISLLHAAGTVGGWLLLARRLLPFSITLNTCLPASWPARCSPTHTSSASGWHERRSIPIRTRPGSRLCGHHGPATRPRTGSQRPKHRHGHLDGIIYDLFAKAALSWSTHRPNNWTLKLACRYGRFLPAPRGSPPRFHPDTLLQRTIRRQGSARGVVILWSKHDPPLSSR